MMYWKSWMKSISLINGLRRRYLLLFALASTFFFVFNPQGLNFEYGSGGGRYADRGDSFSEYIVRNTIKRNVLNKGDSSILPIVTKGYASEDYSYYSDGYYKYSSNLILQTIPATILANIFKINTERKLEIFFGALRLTNALFFSVFLSGIFLIFCNIQKTTVAFLIPLLVGCSSGFIYFSQNLYFFSSLIVFPAFFIAVQLNNRATFNKSIVIFLGVLYFLRGYEFATIFALLTGFSAALFSVGGIADKAKSFFIAFTLICVSFFIAIILHIIFVSADSGWALSATEAAQVAFSSLHKRTGSIYGVPFPLSTQFIDTMKYRWSYPAFSISNNGFALSEMNIILLLLSGFFIRLRKMTVNEYIIYFYGFSGYASWYIFAYQHIMWHNMYDWYIFALTLGLSFGFLVIFYGSLVVKSLQNIWPYEKQLNSK